MTLNRLNRVNRMERSGRPVASSPLRIFFSYAEPDRAIARKLRSRLENLQSRDALKVFSDDDLSPGERWLSELRDELKNSNVILAVFSGNSAGSEWQMRELGAAWALNKPIIPILIDPKSAVSIPIDVSDAVVFKTQNFDKEIEKVMDQVREQLDDLSNAKA